MSLPPRLRLLVSLVVILVCLLLGLCSLRREAEPVRPPAPQPVPMPLSAAPPVVAAPAPPAPPPVVVTAPPAPPAPSPEPPPDVVAPPLLPEPAAQPIPAPAVVPPVDAQAARRAAIRAELVKAGYRYGGKAPGQWPPQLLEEEIERRLKLAPAAP